MSHNLRYEVRRAVAVRTYTVAELAEKFSVSPAYLLGFVTAMESSRDVKLSPPSPKWDGNNRLSPPTGISPMERKVWL